jgi:TP53 regulating kinase-like protein
MEGWYMKGEVVALGAESSITKVTRWGRTLAVKTRPEKPYLLKDIDSMLRSSRTSREAKALTIARSLGIPTPAVYSVDSKNHTIVMDYIPGQQFKEIAGSVQPDKLRALCREFGRLIAVLHREGIVHGDPTTSNIIVDSDMTLWMIDFGLAEMNASVEMKGVDLHLIRRALETTHWDLQDFMLEHTLAGYTEALGAEADAVLLRMEEIRERGRYH